MQAVSRRTLKDCISGELNYPSLKRALTIQVSWLATGSVRQANNLSQGEMITVTRYSFLLHLPRRTTRGAPFYLLRYYSILPDYTTYYPITDNLISKAASATTYTATLSTTHLYSVVGRGLDPLKTPHWVIFAHRISITDVFGKPLSGCSIPPLLMLP